MSEREHDFIDYIKNALDNIEGGSTSLFLLKQDLKRIIEWKTERDQFKEAFKKQALHSGELEDKFCSFSEQLDNPPMYFAAIDYETREAIDVYPLREVRDFMDRLKAAITVSAKPREKE